MTITLATLPQATAQEVIDQGYLHLLTQNEASRDENGTCSYRSPNGLKCAAGCFIADDEYQKWMDTHEGDKGTDWDTISEILGIDNFQVIIRKLQYVHDKRDYPHRPNAWKGWISKIAKEHGLEDPVQKYPEPEI